MNRKLLVIGICLVILVLSVYFVFLQSSNQNHIQNTNIEWSKTFGGNDEDTGSFVFPTIDEGCIVTGCTESYGQGKGDLWLIKVDKNGKEEWNETFGGSEWDEGKAVEQLDDGSYIVVGRTASFGHGKTDIWLIKVNQTGKEEWNTTWGGPGWDEGNSIKKTDDDGYIVVGDTTSYSSGEYDICLIKFNSSGDERWNETFGGTENEGGRFVEITDDGGYAIAGETESYGSGEIDIWLIKVNQTGKKEWSVTFGGKDDDLSNELMQTDDGGFIIVGHNVINEPVKLNGFVIKVDGEGNVQWEKIISMNKSAGTSSIDTTKEGYIAVGYIGDYGTEQNLLLVKLDLSGNLIWNCSIGGDGHGDAGVWIQRCTDEQYFIAGYSDINETGKNDVWVLKVDIN